ncbi:MAG TPA: sporulation protein [Actinomycetota bacterium]|nr:sporulation protein [Actinomycetota bacterium]
MKAQEFVGQAKDVLTVKRVFGDPYEKNGVTVIPAAAVRGAGGGGSGEGPDGEGGSGSGGGFGLTGRPVGAYVIKDGVVTWQPAVDLTRVILGGQVLAVVMMLVLRSMRKTRAKVKRAKIRKGG